LNNDYAPPFVISVLKNETLERLPQSKEKSNSKTFNIFKVLSDPPFLF